MIEEKLTIDFGEYVSYFHATGKLRDVAEIVQPCSNAIHKAINNLLSGATVVSHHGFNIRGKDFRASVDVSASFDDDDDDRVTLNISNTFDSTVSAEFSFDATLKLEMTKTNNHVVIDSRMV